MSCIKLEIKNLREYECSTDLSDYIDEIDEFDPYINIAPDEQEELFKSLLEKVEDLKEFRNLEFEIGKIPSENRDRVCKSLEIKNVLKIRGII